MPKIASVAKNNVKIANTIEIPFLNIVFSFICLTKYMNKGANLLIINVKDC